MMDWNDPAAWVAYAEVDLKAAATRDIAMPAWFHCHHGRQAAEKAIKAVYVARGIAFEYTHDIAVLLGALKRRGLDVPESIRVVDRLNKYAASTRYPGAPGHEEPTEADRVEAVRLAQTALDWSRAEIAAADGGR